MLVSSALGRLLVFIRFALRLQFVSARSPGSHFRFRQVGENSKNRVFQMKLFELRDFFSIFGEIIASVFKVQQ